MCAGTLFGAMPCQCTHFPIWSMATRRHAPHPLHSHQERAGPTGGRPCYTSGRMVGSEEDPRHHMPLQEGALGRREAVGRHEPGQEPAGAAEERDGRPSAAQGRDVRPCQLERRKRGAREGGWVVQGRSPANDKTKEDLQMRHRRRDQRVHEHGQLPSLPKPLQQQLLTGKSTEKTTFLCRAGWS